MGAYLGMGLQTGAIKYTSFVDTTGTLKTDGGGGKTTFNWETNSFMNDVGVLYAYSIDMIVLNSTVFEFHFDYDINSVKLYGKTNSSSSGVVSELTGATISADKRTIYIQTSLNTSITNVYLLIYVNPPVSDYSVTQNLVGVTSDFIDSTVPIDSENVINFSADSGYKIETITSNVGTVYISEDKLTGSVEFLASENVVINVNSIRYPLVLISGTFENCTCNYINGEFYDIEKSIIITADVGFTFDNWFSYEIDGVTKDFETIGNTLIATPIDTQGDIDLIDIYVAIKKVETISDFVRLYYTNEEELTALSKERFVSDSSGVFDYGTFITSLYKLPFTIPETLKGSKSVIVLGTKVSTVESTSLLNYILEVDIGEIFIPEKYQNVYDYLDTDCIIHLPYFDSIYLNSEYVINQTISIKYIIDLYSGNVTVNIYSTFIDGIIETQTQQIAINIPFMQRATNNVVSSLSKIYNNVIDTAYIEIVRNIPYTVDTLFGKESIDYDIIGSKNGYIEVSDVVLNTNATNDEKEEIKDLLKGGIFIE